MELQDIAKLVYEITRVKEDRLLMKWEDDRAHWLAEVERLREAYRGSCDEIARQQSDYNTLLHTVASFGTKRSPPRVRLSQNGKEGVNNSSTKNQPGEDKDGFITINRSKGSKTGPMHSFFARKSETVNAPSSSSSGAVVNGTRTAARLRSPTRADAFETSAINAEDVVTQLYKPSGNLPDQSQSHGPTTVQADGARSTNSGYMQNILSCRGMNKDLLTTNAAVDSGEGGSGSGSGNNNGDVNNRKSIFAKDGRSESPALGDAALLDDDSTTCAGVNRAPPQPHPADVPDSQATCASEPASHSAVKAAQPSSRRVSLQDTTWPPSPSQTQSPQRSQELPIGVRVSDYDAPPQPLEQVNGADWDETQSPLAAALRRRLHDGAQRAGRGEAAGVGHARAQDSSERGRPGATSCHGVEASGSGSGSGIDDDAKRRRREDVIDLSDSPLKPHKAPDLQNTAAAPVGTTVNSRDQHEFPKPQARLFSPASDYLGGNLNTASAKRGTLASSGADKRPLVARSGDGGDGDGGHGGSDGTMSKSATASRSAVAGASPAPKKAKRAAVAPADSNGINSGRARKGDFWTEAGGERENCLPNIVVPPGGREGFVKPSRTEDRCVDQSAVVEPRSGGGGSGSGSSSAAPLNTTTTTAAPAKVQAKSIDTVRNKAARAALPGFTCEECAKFYETMVQQGIYDMNDSQVRREVLQSCSRHKSRWTPPSTPEGFWNLTLQTPDDWR